MADALAQSQVANQEILKQLHEMSGAVLHPVSQDWNPVTFKLTEERADGPPATGFSLLLTRLEGAIAMVMSDANFSGGGIRNWRGGMAGQGGGMGGMGGGVGGMGGGMGEHGRLKSRSGQDNDLPDVGQLGRRRLSIGTTR